MPKKVIIQSILLIFCLLSLKPALGDDATSSWQTIQSAEGKFSISMPGTATFHQDKVKEGGKDVTLNLYTFNPPGTIYQAAYADYGQDLLANTPTEKFIDNIEGGFLKSIEGTATEEHPLTIQGFPARDVLFKAPAFRGELQVIVVKYRVYILAVAARNANPIENDLPRYFGSFRLTDTSK